MSGRWPGALHTGASLLLALCFVATAHAADEEPAAAGAPPKQRVIEEIIVTATKREESLREIPQSIAAFSGENLEIKGLLSADDFLQQSPGVITNTNAPGDKRITIRGVETTTRGATPNGTTTGFLIGDVSLNDPAGGATTPEFSSFDIRSVEVLKGPQGTLFGATALAGAVRYNLAEADPAEWAFKAFTMVETVDQGTTRFSHGAALNVPILDQAAVRLTIVERNYPGWIDDVRVEEPEVVRDANQGDGRQLRLHALWEPSESWRFEVTALEEDYAAPYGLALYSDEPGGPPVSSENLIPQFNNFDFSLQSVKASWEWSSFSITGVLSRTAVSRHILIEADNGPPEEGQPDESALGASTRQESTSFSQELRAQSRGDGWLRWLVGIYNYRYDLDLDLVLDTVGNQQVNGPDAPGGPRPETYVLDLMSSGHVLERAAFIDLTLQPLPPVEVRLGARLYRTEFFALLQSRGALGLPVGDGTIDPETRTRDFPVELTEKGLSPRVSVSWDATENLSTYWSIARGFRIGGYNLLLPEPGEDLPIVFDSDFLWNYEFGIRTDWLDGSLQLDSAVFYIDWKNAIVAQNSDSLISQDFRSNAAKAVSRGVEVSLLWLPPLDGMTISAAGGWLDAFISAPFAGAGGVTVPAGNRLPGSARWQATATLSQTHSLGPVDLHASFTPTYIGPGFADMQNLQPINDYMTYSGTLTARLPEFWGTPALSTTGLNLANTSHRTLANGYDPNDASAGARDLNTRPRTIIARLSVEF